MKKKLRIAFDFSAFAWRALTTGRDSENGYEAVHKDKKVWINSVEHGYDICLPLMLKVLDTYKRTPVDCILVFEGSNSKSKRLLIDNQYKAGREHPTESYTEFLALKERMRVLWKELGAQMLTQDFTEADDTLAFLAQNTEDDLVVATFDNDLVVLNTVNDHGAVVETWIDGLQGINKYGLFDHHLVTTYKALVGDTSDNIKGCAGFGKAKMDDFIGQYGFDGMQELHDFLASGSLMPLAEMADEVTGMKKGAPVYAHPLVRKIFEQAPQVIRCFNLAKLHPEWVDTMRSGLQWEAGMVRPLRASDDRRLRKWYGRSRLITGAMFLDACAWALPLINASDEVALDIETSSADESDDWLAAQRTPQSKGDGVDVFGSTLTGLSLTFGDNNQYSLYFSVDHADTDNCDSELLREFIAKIKRPLVIQNMSFELAVLFNEWGARQLDNGFHGFLPNVLDTKFEASYVNENAELGLKQRSLSTLGYEQQTYDDTTILTGPVGTLPKGGRLLRETEEVPACDAYLGDPKMEEVAETAAGAVERIIYDIDGVPRFEAMDEVVVGETHFRQLVLDGVPQWFTPPYGPVDGMPAMQTRQYKMNELTGAHVLGYGCDDTICTIALHNHYRLVMQLEHTYEVCKEVEIDAAYMHAKSFIDGCCVSIERMNQLAAADTITYDKAWAVVRTYLIEKGWEGTQPPVYTAKITAAEVKEAFHIVTGRKMDTAMRTVSKLATYADKVEERPVFAMLLTRMIEKHEDESIARMAEKAFTDYVCSHYSGEPQFNDGSPKQMQHLMYDVMGLEIKVRNKPTDAMRKAGIKEGTAKTDALAIAYAMLDCSPEIKSVLEALNLMAMVGTRRSLYYDKYPHFPHWKDGKVRSQHNQCGTNTRRASESKPNKQQLPKTQKIEGHAARFREVIVPHRPDAVIVSIDFKAQELRIIADYSQDPNMLSCYIGENLRDQHSLTGLGIAKRKYPQVDWSYEAFEAARADKSHPQFKIVKDCRILGKKTNFTTEYGAMAPKLAVTLMVTEDEAQDYIDAKDEMFSVANDWKDEVIAEAKRNGYVTTMKGARRHLRDALNSSDRWEASKAERQAVNFKIQSSSAEQTKLAEGRMWRADLAYKFDAQYIGPIHDEVVWSVAIADLYGFIPALHACMVAPYAQMAVPIEGDISFGLDFYNQIEIGPVPSKAAIDKGLAELRAQQAEHLELAA